MIDMQVNKTTFQSLSAGAAFPLVYQASGNPSWLDIESWLTQHRDELLNQSATHGVLLFRGLPLSTATDFDRFVTAFNLPNFTYKDSLSNAVRTNLTDRVFTANEAPPDIEIFLHHEMAQTPIYPSRLFFFCETAPTAGGATPVCRSDQLYELMCEQLPTFAADCEAKGLRYTNVMPAEDDAQSGQGRSWRSTFRAADKAEAERRMASLGYTWEWREVDNHTADTLAATTPTLPAVRELANGRKAFFNQLIAAFKGWKDMRNDPSKAITFGDGSALNPTDVLAAADLAEQITVDLQWQQGDVSLVDNYVAMHGRRPFEGHRRVLASLIAS